MPPKTTTWAMAPHTKAKHDLLRRYLGAWFPIMARFEKKLLFIDGFAGPGRYDNGDPGSPIVALEALMSHQHFTSMASTTFMFVFVEEDKRRTAMLREELTVYFTSKGGQPANIQTTVMDSGFDGAANDLVDSIPKGYKLIPTLAFIDPFGFSGISMDSICRLTSFPKCEVVFSFMYGGLSRWITHPDEAIHISLRDLFGTEDYEDAADLSGAERRTFLHNLYKQSLRSSGSFKYALDFEMVDARGKNVYSLIFATRHLTGLAAMKEAMWKVDPSGGFRFSDRHAGMTSIFGTEVDVGPLEAAMLAEFGGHQTTIEEIEEFVLAETIYGKSHFRRAVLAKLEKTDTSLHVVTSTRKVANGYPPNTVLRFD